MYQPTCLPVGQAGVGGVEGADDEGVFAVAAPFRTVGDVGLERGVAALVRGDLRAVDPDVGAVVDGLETEPDATVAEVLGDLNVRRYQPMSGASWRGPDAGKLALPGEWDDDLAVEPLGAGLVPLALEPRVVRVEPELPGAVQVGPVRPHGLRSGVLGAGDRVGVAVVRGGRRHGPGQGEQTDQQGANHVGKSPGASGKARAKQRSSIRSISGQPGAGGGGLARRSRA